MTIRKAHTKISLEGVPTRFDDFEEKKLAQAINVPARNRVVVEVYKQQAQEHARRSTLVFAVNQQHISDLVETFKEHGIDARGVDSKTPPHERQQLLQDFRVAKFPVLINCGECCPFLVKFDQFS
jgi:ATP-dependent helicase IRC3